MRQANQTGFRIPTSTTAVTVTWDPAQTSPAITLSGGNLTAAGSASSVFACTLATSNITHDSYFEMHVDALGSGGNLVIGWAEPGYNFNSFYMGNVDGAGKVSGGYAADGNLYFEGAAGIPISGGWVVGDVIQLAIRSGSPTGNVWLGKNNTWYNNSSTGAFDPLSPTNGGFGGGVISKAGCSPQLSGYAGTARFRTADFSYLPPVGFSSYSGF